VAGAGNPQRASAFGYGIDRKRPFVALRFKHEVKGFEHGSVTFQRKLRVFR
jgi:hypothetical protein